MTQTSAIICGLDLPGLGLVSSCATAVPAVVFRSHERPTTTALRSSLVPCHCRVGSGLHQSGKTVSIQPNAV